MQKLENMNDIRAKFESWVQKETKDSIERRVTLGDYASVFTQSQWEAWEAGVESVQLPKCDLAGTTFGCAMAEAAPVQHGEQFPSEIRNDALEEAAKRIEHGSFMHDQSPAKLFSVEVAKAIRALKATPPKEPT